MKIAKKLKKNNVAVDVVSFGHEAENEEKLSAFHGAVNSNDNSHIVTVPPGPVLSDVLINSPIFQARGLPRHIDACDMWALATATPLPLPPTLLPSCDSCACHTPHSWFSCACHTPHHLP